jgi:hypothetical protein
MLHEGDIGEVLLLAENIADAPGTSPDHPEAHGTAEERQVWLMAGYNTGDPSYCQIYYANRSTRSVHESDTHAVTPSRPVGVTLCSLCQARAGFSQYPR